MNEVLDFLVRHGAAVLFAVVFIEQMGVSLLVTPCSVVADLIWFYMGRHYGNRVLNLLCRISLEPDSCVRRTQDVFTRNGMRGVVAAKFIPGLSTLAPPLAGSSGVSAARFFSFDGAGSILYGGAFI